MSSAAFTPEISNNQLRRWTVRIRTIAMTPFQCVLTGITEELIYQKIPKKALHLKELGLSNYRIAELLNVNDKTVAKALKYIND